MARFTSVTEPADAIVFADSTLAVDTTATRRPLAA